LSEKNFALAWGPGPGKFGLKLPKHALIVTLHTKNTKSMPKKMHFWSEIEDLPNP